MKALVVQSYQRPFENPLSVSAGEGVNPNFDQSTAITGWVWCTAEDGRSGWTPEAWLIQSNGKWHLDRDYNAIELTVAVGEFLEIILEESGFYWARTENSESGWVPCENVSVDQLN